VKTHITCPCGEAITAKDEDELVELTQAHLASVHPGWITTATPSCSWRTDPGGAGQALRHDCGADCGHELALPFLGGDLPKIVDMMLPEPVSAIAVNVVGPSALISERGLSVTLPDLPVVRFTQVTFSAASVLRPARGFRRR